MPAARVDPRLERIAKMMENGKWTDATSPFGLVKTRVQKIVLKKKAKKEATEGGDAAAAAPGAACSSGAAAREKLLLARSNAGQNKFFARIIEGDS